MKRLWTTVMFDSNTNSFVEPDPASVQARYGEWRVERAYVFNPAASKTDTLWDGQKVVDMVAALPSADLTGVPLIAAWEGTAMDALVQGSSHGSHAQVLSQCIALAQVLADEGAGRPEMAFGFYGLPTRQYWTQDAAWRTVNDELDTLWPEVTALFPSVLDFYPCSTSKTHGNYQCIRDHERFGEIVKLASEKAKDPGNDIPIYPVCWDRFHNSTADGFKLIGEIEMIDHVRNAAQRAQGAVAYNKDLSYHTRAFSVSSPGACGYGDGVVDVCTAAWSRVRNQFTAEMNLAETITAYLERKQAESYRRYAVALGLIAAGIETVAKAIRKRFDVEVTLQENLTTVYDNDPTDPPDPGTTDLWVRFRVEPDANDQTTFGDTRSWRMSGRAIAECRATVGTGTLSVNTLADSIMAPFRSVTASGVRYTSPYPQEVGRDGAWWQVNVVLPWYTDVSA